MSRDPAGPGGSLRGRGGAGAGTPPRSGLRRGERMALGLLISILVALGLMLSVLAVCITLFGGLVVGESVHDQLDGGGAPVRHTPAGGPGPSWWVTPPGDPSAP